jgi:hypothetical protein
MTGFVDEAGYHRDRSCDSHSTLEVFRESPPLYHQTFVLGQGAPAAPCLNFGSAFHAYLLHGRERYHDELVAVAPALDRRTKLGRETYTRFVEDARGRLVVSQAEHATVVAMAAAVRHDRAARVAFDTAGLPERAVRFTWHGAWLKARFDWMLDDAVVDVKTAADVCPKAWLRAVERYGYHRQASLYAQGFLAVVGKRPAHYHVVVGKKSPHTTLVYQLGPASLGLGDEQNQETIWNLCKSRSAGDWSHPLAHVVNVVELPTYAFKK